MLRGGDLLQGWGRGGERQACHLPVGKGRGLVLRGARGQLGVVTAGPLLALFSGLRWETTFSFPLSVPCVSNMTGIWGPRAPGALVRPLCLHLVWASRSWGRGGSPALSGESSSLKA